MMTRLVKIGLFVLITGTGSVVYVMQTAETINAPDTYQVKARIEDASGLLPGTRVWVSGVTVGRVRDVRLVGGKAQLLMEISSDVPVYRDAAVEKTMQSMLGNAVVTLKPGSPQKKRIEPGGRINRVVGATAMDRTFSQVESISTELTTFMEDLNAFMNEGGGYQHISEMLETAQGTMETTNRLVEKNLTLLSQSMERIANITERLDTTTSEEMEELSKVLSHTASIAEQLDTQLQDNSSDIDESMSSVNESLDRLNDTLASLQTVTGKIEKGEGNVGKFVNDESIYNRVDRVTQNVDELVNTAMGLNVNVGVDSEYLALQRTARTRAQVRLDPEGKPKYYSLGVVDTPSMTSTTTETRRVVRGGGSASETITTETVRTNELKLSAQMAREFGPLTLRGGVIENTAGAGLDYQPVDQLSVSAEMFDFGQENAPYLRSYGTFYPAFDPSSSNPLNWLYLTGGVDNALHNGRRDYFFGVGIELQDDDLRTVLPFAPTP
jgi:phospholipid/cholesterol/gamma-HCH transport system substrate-binding protein